jgi:hypothetical protein
METPYKAVEFTKHEVVTRQTLDQMQSNLQWIKDNTPRSRVYAPNGVPTDVLTVIVSGKALIKKNKKSDTGHANVKFRGNIFDPRCRPHVTRGINAGFQRNIFCTLHGPGKTNYPDSTGFAITVNIAADKDKQDAIKKNFYVHWQAHGYRKDNMNV